MGRLLGLLMMRLYLLELFFCSIGIWAQEGTLAVLKLERKYLLCCISCRNAGKCCFFWRAWLWVLVRRSSCGVLLFRLFWLFCSQLHNKLKFCGCRGEAFVLLKGEFLLTTPWSRDFVFVKLLVWLILTCLGGLFCVKIVMVFRRVRLFLSILYLIQIYCVTCWGRLLVLFIF